MPFAFNNPTILEYVDQVVEAWNLDLLDLLLEHIGIKLRQPKHRCSYAQKNILRDLLGMALFFAKGKVGRTIPSFFIGTYSAAVFLATLGANNHPCQSREDRSVGADVVAPEVELDEALHKPVVIARNDSRMAVLDVVTRQLAVESPQYFSFLSMARTRLGTHVPPR